MIVDMRSLDPAWALDQATTLDDELFGKDAWSADEIADELIAPDRVYLADVIEPRNRSTREISGNGLSEQGWANPESVDDIPETSHMLNVSTMHMRGYAGMWCAQDEAEVLTIDVAPNDQRQGVGENLLRTLIDEARRRKARRMSLQTRIGNTPALKLYGKLGFRRAGTLKGYYGPRNGDAYELVLDFEPRRAGFAPSSMNEPDWRDDQRGGNTTNTMNDNDMKMQAPADSAKGRMDDE